MIGQLIKDLNNGKATTEQQIHAAHIVDQFAELESRILMLTGNNGIIYHALDLRGRLKISDLSYWTGLSASSVQSALTALGSRITVDGAYYSLL